ncbi:MAG: DUF86 domain-containing protein [Marinoscillum sp.]
MDDVIQAKVATIEKCLRRIKEETTSDWRHNYTHQDALLLNLERACQETIDCAAHIVKKQHLGVPKVTREFFSLRKMVGFRNLAVHDYAHLNLDILESIITKELEVFGDFCKSVIDLDFQ